MHRELAIGSLGSPKTFFVIGGGRVTATIYLVGNYSRFLNVKLHKRRSNDSPSLLT